MASSEATVRVHGLEEMIRTFQKISLEVARELKTGLKKVAEPVAVEGRQRIGIYGGASTSTIKPYASLKGVVVRQAKSKTTGRHAGFGSLQMGHLMGALDSQADEIRSGMEKWLDDITDEGI